MQVILTSFLSAFGAGILTLVIMSIKWLYKKISTDSLTMKALAHDAYFRQARELYNKDFITEAELENHEYLYQAYHSQGLNGVGDKLHSQILSKEVK
jgi:hypothetical protein